MACIQCGGTLTGRQRRFCSRLCESRWWNRSERFTNPCQLDGCEKAATVRGLCPMHYQRQRTRGTVGAATRERLSHQAAVCAVVGCGQQRRKQDWCATHYNQWRRTGRVWSIKHREVACLCLVCGAAPGGGYRQFCGHACRNAWRAHDGQRPSAVRCVCCGELIDVTVRGKNGRLQRHDIRVCPKCRVTYRKHGMSVQELAQRDGLTCGICGGYVDMILRAPDPDCPSVDHILPRALGGSNEPENLQLAHRYCNSVKSDLRNKVCA